MAPIASECAAQSPADHRPSFVSPDAVVPIGRMAPGKWGLLSFGVRNPTGEPVEVLASTHFDGRPDLQYGRLLRVPPHSLLRSWYPVLVPGDLPAGKTLMPIRSLLIDRRTTRPLSSPSGQVFHEGLLAIEHENRLTGVIVDGADPAIHNTIAAARQSRSLSSAVGQLRGRLSPPRAETLEALDHLVLASDRLMGDIAGLTAVRRWLHAGGRLWIMLDQVDSSTASMLLGDAFRCHVVDRLKLSQVEIRGVQGKRQSRNGRRLALEVPVEIVRVVGPDLQTTHTVNGWPAAFWLSAGRGTVLCTTLGARGWIPPRMPNDPVPRDAQIVWPFVASAPLEDLASEFFAARQPPLLQPGGLREFASEQIGYRIIGRGMVVGVLGGFCLALLLASAWLARRGKLERLGWIGPAMAVVCSAVVVLVGYAHRNAVPPTVSVVQVAEADPDVREARISGAAAVYNREESSSPLGAEGGAVLALDMAGLSGRTRRMVWTDLDRWQWENLVLPPGVRTASLRYSLSTGPPIRARAAFGPEGLTGRLEAGPFRDLRDAILVTDAQHRMAVRLEPDGRFQVGPGDLLAPGQFLDGAMLSDLQRRQQAVYRQLLEGAGSHARGAGPATILAWAAPLEMPLTLAGESHQTGAALLVAPLALDRTPPGTPVTVPPPFLPYLAVPGPGLPSFSAAFDNRERVWLGPLLMGTRAFLRFQLPAELLPLRCRRALLSVSIRAPSRRLEILGLAANGVVSLAASSSPLGTLRFEITRPDVLQLDPAGGLTLGVDVGSAAEAKVRETSVAGWKIDEVQLELSGETLAP